MSRTSHHGASKYRPEARTPSRPKLQAVRADDLLEVTTPSRELAIGNLIAWVGAVPEDPEMKRQAAAGVDFMREALCEHVAVNSITVAVKDGVTLVHMSDDRLALIRVRDVNSSKLVFFDVVDVRKNLRATFWYNAHSVTNVGNALRKLPRRTMREIFDEAVL